ncbi:YciI family protein [Propionicicella superfundia]|uniref:YciI family protein n=1 Tax=Propionicicella superfundia TaxID=348582 RepID=UPI00048E4FAA|nr:YciI family protein [Propionicicella superfundia]
MATFAVIYTYSDDTELRAAVRPRHRAYLGGLGEQSICLVAGAWTPTEPPGALLVFRADSKEEVEDLLANDPFVTEGYVVDKQIFEWGAGIGPLAKQFQ